MRISANTTLLLLLSKELDCLTPHAVAIQSTAHQLTAHERIMVHGRGEKHKASHNPGCTARGNRAAAYQDAVNPACVLCITSHLLLDYVVVVDTVLCTLP